MPRSQKIKYILRGIAMHWQHASVCLAQAGRAKHTCVFAGVYPPGSFRQQLQMDTCQQLCWTMSQAALIMISSSIPTILRESEAKRPCKSAGRSFPELPPFIGIHNMSRKSLSHIPNHGRDSIAKALLAGEYVGVCQDRRLTLSHAGQAQQTRQGRLCGPDWR